MLTKLQQHFRFYLALALTGLLAAGVRLQAAPLGAAHSAAIEADATRLPMEVASAPR